jgi:hypothetical protein
MSALLANASRLKPEIRLAQAVSQFEADLSSEHKAAFHTYRSQSHNSPPSHTTPTLLRENKCFKLYSKTISKLDTNIAVGQPGLRGIVRYRIIAITSVKSQW